MISSGAACPKENKHPIAKINTPVVLKIHLMVLFIPLALAAPGRAKSIGSVVFGVEHPFPVPVQALKRE
jgi:hypothetical protein